jgi:hypothetical protein
VGEKLDKAGPNRLNYADIFSLKERRDDFSGTVDDPGALLG